MSGGQLKWFGKEPVLAGGPFSVFLDVQSYSAVGVVGAVVFGPLFDFQLYSTFGVVGFVVSGFFFHGGLVGRFRRGNSLVGGLFKLGVLGDVPPHSRVNFSVLAPSGVSAREAGGGSGSIPVDLDKPSASVRPNFAGSMDFVAWGFVRTPQIMPRLSR